MSINKFWVEREGTWSYFELLQAEKKEINIKEKFNGGLEANSPRGFADFQRFKMAFKSKSSKFYLLADDSMYKYISISQMEGCLYKKRE